MVDDTQQLMTYIVYSLWKKKYDSDLILYVFDSLKAFSDDGAVLNGNR